MNAIYYQGLIPIEELPAEYLIGGSSDEQYYVANQLALRDKRIEELEMLLNSLEQEQKT